MSILLFAFAVAPCCYCADSFVDTPPLVVLRSECSGFVVKGDLGSKCLEERLKTGQFLADVMLMVICGVMIWPVGRALGRYKDAIVRAVSCLEGN